MYSQANYFAVLPAAVRYNPKLTARSKLLYAALTSLAVGEGVAYPSNTYIAETFGVDERTAQRLVAELEAQKYISVDFEYRENTKEIARRIIRINPLPSLLDIPTTQALYAVIPSHILALEKLSPQAKLLYAEISAATPTDGYCSKPASFFAELLGASETSVHRWTRELIGCDALRVALDYKGASKEIRNRRMYLTEAAAVVEKRAELGQIPSKTPQPSKEPNEPNDVNTPQRSRILGGVIFVTTSENDGRQPRSVRNRHGKRRRSLMRRRE